MENMGEGPLPDAGLDSFPTVGTLISMYRVVVAD